MHSLHASPSPLVTISNSAPSKYKNTHTHQTHTSKDVFLLLRLLTGKKRRFLFLCFLFLLINSLLSNRVACVRHRFAYVNVPPHVNVCERLDRCFRRVGAWAGCFGRGKSGELVYLASTSQPTATGHPARSSYARHT